MPFISLLYATTVCPKKRDTIQHYIKHSLERGKTAKSNNTSR